jgi:hypothetical protein
MDRNMKNPMSSSTNIVVRPEEAELCACACDKHTSVLDARVVLYWEHQLMFRLVYGRESSK